TGNVVMYSRPQQEHISDVFVKTSTRRGTIETEVEVSGNKTAGPWLFKSEVVDSKGQVIKTFEKSIALSAANNQTISVSANWNNPKLWELDNPNIYTVKVSMCKNKRLHDTYVQTFGFREFWIDGKNFFLNGTRLNLRPFVGVPGDGMEELVAGGIDGLKKNGFNFSELWPNNYDQRGDIQEWHEVMKVADKKGYLLSGVALPFHTYIVGNTWSYQWDKPGVKEGWEKRMLFELKRQRNHPSVILWGTAANFFGHPQDQDPLHIGQVNWIKGNNFWQRNADAAKEAIATIKKHDVTRPVYTHHGAYVGDIHTLNFYLCLIPLQEREEWMSHYSKFGKIPFIGIEFGTPLHCTFLRGRNGFGNNIQTEPWVTEFAAMYTGPSAYFTETDEYRSLIKNHFVGGQKYKPWDEAVEMERMPAFQELQHLFSKNTWRSYRTYEVTGGMVPWNNGHGWVPGKAAGKNVPMPPFQAGRKGNYFKEGSVNELQYLQPEAYQITKGGEAIVENNSEVLAYIANGGEAFTAKDHHFKPGDYISKQFFFFN
ncbi:MAG TPA: glycoside hydrolase family 2 TIM barrel-domain containing protein, partial [Flavisolibacter sp.]|nr:glycoside hydrolase family 2 TIM barrel-domain containing protein [Flavisolibacter sp.]